MCFFALCVAVAVRLHLLACCCRCCRRHSCVCTAFAGPVWTGTHTRHLCWGVLGLRSILGLVAFSLVFAHSGTTPSFSEHSTLLCAAAACAVV